MNQEDIKAQLRDGGDEYHYRDDNCDIGGHLITPKHLEVKHFVVKRSERGNGLASTLLDALLDVLREDGINTLTVEMGATECRTLEERETYRDKHESDDPTVEFLQDYDFRDITPKETYQWGLVFRGTRRV